MERHGGSKTKEYSSWSSMKRRCLDPKDKRYADYGGRGITVCERWLTSFSAFLADMGRKPSPAHTLERRNVNGNYEPSNCCWATQMEQQSNRRDNWFLTIGDTTLTMSEWARRANIGESTLRWRLNRGWSVDDALYRPQRHRPNFYKGGGNRRGPKRDSVKDAQVLKMRAQGMTFQAIANALGVGLQCVNTRYHKAQESHLQKEKQ